MTPEARRDGIAAHPYRVAISPHSLRPRRSLTPTLNFENGSKVPATSGWCSHIIECSHRGHESCEGDLEHDTSKGRFRFRQRCSHHDKSKFPSLSLVSAVG